MISIEILKDKVLFILLDEYDELDIYQQKFINKLIRTRTLTFRIASKIGGIKTFEYIKGKELDEIHDYDPIIPLHFVIPKKNTYKILVKNIFINRLNIYKTYKVTDPNIIFPSPTLKDEGILEEELELELENIHDMMKKKKRNANKDNIEYWKVFSQHNKEAAIYRILRGKSRDKLFAGFNEFVKLSSGIVRLFILLCRDIFSLAHVEGIAIEDGEPIPMKIQSTAAVKVSRNQLLLEVTKTIPSGYGPKLVRLIEDLGRILEAKLYHSTMGQANRFSINNYQQFIKEEYKIPKEIIEYGLRMPHFISLRAFKPFQPESSFSFTFSLNGIFAPYLKIPLEKRWQTSISAEEIKDLCSDEKREEILKKIIRKIKGIDQTLIYPESQTTLSQLLNLQSPITLINCPFSISGCTQNLTQYVLQKEELKSFLAIPFNEQSWVLDPRKWIKQILMDSFKIRCVDSSDFYSLSVNILCKICSSVRQMPIGIFEITELNPNVIFELGMAVSLHKLIFLLVFKKKIPEKYKEDFPPKPLYGIEYLPYNLNRNSIYKLIENNIVPSINESINSNSKLCRIIKGSCSQELVKTNPNKIFIGLPYENDPIFQEVENIIKNRLSNYNLKFFQPAKSLNELCQLCKEIRESSFCIIDTTFQNLSMLFALGIAFGRDKKFIQLHNKELSSTRPISDLRAWAIEYHNIHELETLLDKELKKRVDKINE